MHPIFHLLSLTFNRAVCIGISAMAFYDWVITFDDEVEEIWKPVFGRQLTITIVLFLLSRYSLLSNCVAYSLNLFMTGSDFSCRSSLQSSSVSYFVNDVSTSGIFLLRTWVLSERNIFVLVALTAIVLSKLSLSVVATFTGEISVYIPASIDNVGGCTVGAGRPSKIEFQIYTAIMALTLAFSTAVFGLTIRTTLKNASESRAAGIRKSLNSLLLRDGIQYYSSFVLVTAARLFCNYYWPSGFYLGTSGSWIATSLDPIIVCRLVLKLRRERRNDENEMRLISSSQFLRNINNIGIFGSQRTSHHQARLESEQLESPMTPASPTSPDALLDFQI